jgi:hypothetical protein
MAFPERDHNIWPSSSRQVCSTWRRRVLSHDEKKPSLIGLPLDRGDAGGTSGMCTGCGDRCLGLVLISRHARLVHVRKLVKYHE